MRIRPVARAALCALAASSLLGCLDDIELPPLEPVLLPIINPVRVPEVLVQGTKPAGTGILLAGERVVEPDDEEAWNWQLALAPGDNTVSVKTVSASGLQSLGAAEATVVYEPDFPASPTLVDPRSPTNAATQTLSGTKPADTSLVLIDTTAGTEAELVALSATTDWSADVTLAAPGVYDFALVAADARGKRSEPVDFTLEYDVTPPSLASRYPEGDVQLPTNGILSIAFDGRLTFETEAVPADVVSVRNGITDVALGSISYQPASRALRVHAAAGWPASATLTVTVDHQAIVDVAGNANATRPADFIWTFTTGAADDLTLPPAPVITEPAGDNLTVQTATVHLAGTKPAGTGVILGGDEVLPVTASTDWDLDWLLPIGAPATLSIALVSSAEQIGPPATRTFTREVVRPNPPVLSPAPPAEVSEPTVTLSGTRDADTAVVLNGTVVVPRAADTTWSYNARMVPGLNTLRLQAKSVQEGVVVLSDVVEANVEYAQAFAGDLPAGYGLVVSYGLRNLDAVQPIRAEFATGPSNYSVDLWLEGPLDDGEQCSFDTGSMERRDIKYAATLEHYKGAKAGHTNPWGDEDYANPDYVAALISAGLLSFAPGVDRRDDGSGAPGDAITGGGGSAIQITQDEVDTAIDGVTQATLKPGQRLVTWPNDGAATRFDGAALPQGEYVLHLVINLDRSPGWVAGNDRETCWGDADFARVGPHRVSARLGLGDVPFSLTLGQAAEESGADAESGADVLRYLANSGVTIVWAPL